MARTRRRLWNFLFQPDSGVWVGVLRIGLGLQITFYAWSLRLDWNALFASGSHGVVNRALAEAVLSAESDFIPRLGWFISAGQFVGLEESTALTLIWILLLSSGLFLLLGLFCRTSAFLAWLLYLSSVKSGTLFSYGVDNFTTIGLFYLAIAPLPDGLALDSQVWKRRLCSRERLGFHRRILQLHLCVVYFFSGISKTLGVEWWNGESVWRALTRPPFDLIPADRLIHFAFLFPVIGLSVCLLETGYTFFIWGKQTRPLWLSGILLMHISIGLTMGLYLFAFIMIVLNLAAFGPEYLLALQKRLRSGRKRTIIPEPS